MAHRHGPQNLNKECVKHHSNCVTFMSRYMYLFYAWSGTPYQGSMERPPQPGLSWWLIIWQILQRSLLKVLSNFHHKPSLNISSPHPHSDSGEWLHTSPGHPSQSFPVTARCLMPNSWEAIINQKWTKASSEHTFLEWVSSSLQHPTSKYTSLLGNTFFACNSCFAWPWEKPKTSKLAVSHILEVTCDIIGGKRYLVKKIIYAICIHPHSPWSLFNMSLKSSLSRQWILN